MTKLQWVTRGYKVRRINTLEYELLEYELNGQTSVFEPVSGFASATQAKQVTRSTVRSFLANEIEMMVLNCGQQGFLTPTISALSSFCFRVSYGNS